jgi:hypothetical protein
MNWLWASSIERSLMAFFARPKLKSTAILADCGQAASGAEIQKADD